MTQQNTGGVGWLARLRARLRGGSGDDVAGKADKAEARQRLEEWAASWERPAWWPVVTDDGASLSITRFGGAPWVLDGESPPRCEACGRELQLFVQLELASLPAEFTVVKREGVVQLFYCRGGKATNEHNECSGESGDVPFSTVVKLARLVPDANLRPVPPDPSGEAPWPAKVVSDWERFVDRPDSEDHAAMGLLASYDFGAKTVHFEADSVGVAQTFGINELTVEQLSEAAGRDKLGGWPCWIQGPEYPRCSVCGDTMEVIFQLDSGDHVPFMFGDAGIGHISMCRWHPDVVAFGWAGS